MREGRHGTPSEALDADAQPDPLNGPDTQHCATVQNRSTMHQQHMGHIERATAMQHTPYSVLSQAAGVCASAFMGACVHACGYGCV